MQKTNEFVQFTGCTTFFPKIIVTREEMERMMGRYQIYPSWIRKVVANYEEFPDLMERKQKQGIRFATYQKLVQEYAEHPDDIADDVIDFGNGELDLIDLVVKYGMNHKSCRTFVKDILSQANYPMDVDFYWKQHKKHAQKRTTIALYGVDHTAMRPEVQEKRKETNRRIYGADNPMQNPEIKEKLHKRILEEHGVDYTFQKRTCIPDWQKRLFSCLSGDETWKEILKSVCREANVPYNYGMFGTVLPVNRRDFVISMCDNDHVEHLLRLWVNKTGKPLDYPENALFQLPFAFNKSWLHHYENLGLVKVPPTYYSSESVYEKTLEHYLLGLGIPHIRNHKSALKDRLELDFYFPDKNIAIEVNPNISHNSNLYATEGRRCIYGKQKDPSYHYHKYKLASNTGITLIQLFGNDLEPSVFTRLTAKRLKALLCGYERRYYARQVTVRELKSAKEKKKAREFLDMYHSQGKCPAERYYTFVKDGEWLGIASFSSYKEAGCVELKRLCFPPDVQVVGGLSKLIAHYFNTHADCQAVYSYSDNSIGNGDGYRKAGAIFIRETGPALRFLSPKDGRDSYSWQIATSWGADTGVIGTDARKKGLPKPVGDEEINRYIETELSHRLDDGKGYDRIYTPGSKLWKFERT